MNSLIGGVICGRLLCLLEIVFRLKKCVLGICVVLYFVWVLWFLGFRNYVVFSMCRFGLFRCVVSYLVEISVLGLLELFVMCCFLIDVKVLFV